MVPVRQELKITNKRISLNQAWPEKQAKVEDPRILRIAAAIGRKMARDEIKRIRAAKDDIAPDGKNA
jgi:hypothetical protein